MDSPWVHEGRRSLDNRGFTRRLFTRELLSHLRTEEVYLLESGNNKRGTLRGMHWQVSPGERKLITVSKGAIFDALIDLRPESKDFGKVFYSELNDANNLSLYVPEGFAHGYQTLLHDTRVMYAIDARHNPAQASGINPLSDALLAKWPISDYVAIERDLEYQSLESFLESRSESSAKICFQDFSEVPIRTAP